MNKVDRDIAKVIIKDKPSKNTAKFIIKDKTITAWVKIKDFHNVIYMDEIKNREKDFYEKLECIWKLNLPKELKRNICQEYAKLCAQTIIYNNELEYEFDLALSGMQIDETYEQLMKSIENNNLDES